MFSHIGLGVNDIERSRSFYDGVMEVLGCNCHSSSDKWAGYGRPSDKTTGEDSLWIGVPLDGQPATHGNGTYVAINALNRQMVDQAYKMAISLGGADEGKPGIRAEAHPDFYAAYVRDPDGNKLAFVCHKTK
ncbi:MAG: VOC family protein [Gammaproteobacteria bacterium]|nr:VOC family protein [Gammaproteobacteria bacterium]